jgi:hypothetical protein
MGHGHSQKRNSDQITAMVEAHEIVETPVLEGRAESRAALYQEGNQT